MTSDKTRRDALNNQQFEDIYIHASQEPWIYPDNPKRVWSIDQIGKAVFYYQRELNERFMSVVT